MLDPDTMKLIKDLGSSAAVIVTVVIFIRFIRAMNKDFKAVIQNHLSEFEKALCEQAESNRALITLLNARICIARDPDSDFQSVLRQVKDSLCSLNDLIKQLKPAITQNRVRPEKADL